MKERIFRLINLSVASNEDAKEIVRIHSELFGNASSICATCPTQLRIAIKRLTQYYNDNFR
tara:strand:+ start:54 stop:236 length:183 start_codon:yes stop_codon:yes gene_type:complete